MCIELKYEYKKKGDIVFNFGDIGDKFYVILQGSVSVRIPNKRKEEENKKHLSIMSN